MVMRLRRVLWRGWLSGLLLCGSCFGLAAAADNPTAVVYRLIATLRGAGAADQNNLAGSERPPEVGTANVTHTIFDIPGLSRRTLGKHWEERSPAEQQEFIGLFTQLLSQIAFPQSAVFFRTLEMTVTDERITGQQAVVKMALRHPKEGHIAIDYLLVRHRDTWHIHDIILDSVSLAGNLRSQFNRIITQHSYPELLRRMREKLAHATLPPAR